MKLSGSTLCFIIRRYGINTSQYMIKYYTCKKNTIWNLYSLLFHPLYKISTLVYTLLLPKEKPRVVSSAFGWLCKWVLGTLLPIYINIILLIKKKLLPKEITKGTTIFGMHDTYTKHLPLLFFFINSFLLSFGLVIKGRTNTLCKLSF